MLDFRVKTFLTVCETMNFTRAADRLHVTQPAVSQHIRYLEKEYQVKLFSYQGKKLTLTAAGEKLRQAMRQMQSDERLLKAEIKQADLPPVRFGVTMTIGEYALARPLSRFLKDHPQTNVEVVYGNTQFLTKKLDEGDLDFALVEGVMPACATKARTSSPSARQICLLPRSRTRSLTFLTSAFWSGNRAQGPGRSWRTA